MRFIHRINDDFLRCHECGKYEFSIENQYMDHASATMKWTLKCDTCGHFCAVDNTYIHTTEDVFEYDATTRISVLEEEVKKLRLDLELTQKMFNNFINTVVESHYPVSIPPFTVTLTDMSAEEKLRFHHMLCNSPITCDQAGIKIAEEKKNDE